MIRSATSFHGVVHTAIVNEVSNKRSTVYFVPVSQDHKVASMDMSERVSANSAERNVIVMWTGVC